MRGSGLALQQTLNDGSAQYTYADISTLQFDSDSGFVVTNPDTGIARVAMNSTFKYWEVDGVQKLTAVGLDTVNFIGVQGISISGDGGTTPQSLTLSVDTTGIQATPTTLGTVFGSTMLDSLNVALGNNALLSNTDGYSNTAVGSDSLNNNTIGNDNTAVGSYSLYNNTIGYENTAVGSGSLLNSTIGNDNTAVGNYSLCSNTDGNSNTAVGAYSLNTNTSGVDNVAIGNRALNSNVTGSTNTVIGSNAGYSIWSGSNNIIIGNSADVSLSTTSNQIIIGNNDINRLIIPGIGLDFANSTLIDNNYSTFINVFDTSKFSTAKYLISIKQGAKIRSSEVLVNSDGINVNFTEYGILELGGTISGLSIICELVTNYCYLYVYIPDAFTTNAIVKSNTVLL